LIGFEDSASVARGLQTSLGLSAILGRVKGGEQWFMRAILRATLLAMTYGATACAVVPDLPPDWALPMQEILLHTTCELQQAIRELDGRTNRNQFDARGWTIVVTLNPKVDLDIAPGAGLTRRVPTVGGTRFTNWVVGAGNGLTLDMKGNKTGSVNFKFDSAALIFDNNVPCESETLSYHSLTKYLGIREWLFRSAGAMSLTGSKIDSPSFSADIFINFAGGNSYTYIFPGATDLVTLGGFFKLQETLNINFIAKPKADRFDVVTLPEGGDGFRRNRGQGALTATATILESQQSELQQIRQQLQNLRPANQ
jgi:hypothetical protein